MPANQPQQGAINLSGCNEVRWIRNWLVQECPALAETITFDLLDNALEQAMVAARRQAGLPDYPKPPLGAPAAPAEPTVPPSADLEGFDMPADACAMIFTSDGQRQLYIPKPKDADPKALMPASCTYLLEALEKLKCEPSAIPQGPAPTGEDLGCKLCDGDGWVCESHPEKAWPHKCNCGPGMPCPCSASRAAQPPSDAHNPSACYKPGRSKEVSSALDSLHELVAESSYGWMPAELERVEAYIRALEASHSPLVVYPLSEHKFGEEVLLVYRTDASAAYQLYYHHFNSAMPTPFQNKEWDIFGFIRAADLLAFITAHKAERDNATKGGK